MHLKHVRHIMTLHLEPGKGQYAKGFKNDFNQGSQSFHRFDQTRRAQRGTIS